MTKNSDSLIKILENVPAPDRSPGIGFKRSVDKILASLNLQERNVLYHRFNHKPELHPGECALCGEVFATDGALHRHLAGKHEIDSDSYNPFEKGKKDA